jgi:hypothetical protein
MSALLVGCLQFSTALGSSRFGGFGCVEGCGCLLVGCVHVVGFPDVRPHCGGVFGGGPGWLSQALVCGGGFGVCCLRIV